MINSCKIFVESKDFGFLGGKVCVCLKEVVEMFKIGKNNFVFFVVIFF